MEGKFIVIEGVNGAGKTTTLNLALSLLECGSRVYSKGFTNSSSWDNFINSYPHSSTYYLDLALKTSNQIKPRLTEGKNVLQDRYVQTVDSFLPDSKWLHNQVLRELFDPFFLKPDLYVHFTASVDEVASRLSQTATDKYRLSLVDNPDKIKRREEEYKKIYNKLYCPKLIIDTTGRLPEDCAQELIQTIRRELKCV